MAKWMEYLPLTAMVKCSNLTMCDILYSLKRRFTIIFPAWMQKRAWKVLVASNLPKHINVSSTKIDKILYGNVG